MIWSHKGYGRTAHATVMLAFPDHGFANDTGPGAAMQEIADWLRKLGLGQYAQRFAENDINFAILADLTDQDLKEIGVTSLGHRRQLLRVIAELKWRRDR